MVTILTCPMDQTATDYKTQSCYPAWMFQYRKRHDVLWKIDDRSRHWWVLPATRYTMRNKSQKNCKTWLYLPIHSTYLFTQSTFSRKKTTELGSSTESYRNHNFQKSWYQKSLFSIKLRLLLIHHFDIYLLCSWKLKIYFV